VWIWDPIEVTIPARDKMVKTFKRLKGMDDVGTQEPQVYTAMETERTETTAKESEHAPV